MSEIINSNEEQIPQTLEDIVFANRNKKYGAYDLRKKYKRIVIFAFSISFLIIGSVVAAPLIKAYYDKDKKSIKKETTVTAKLQKMKKEEKPLDIPPPPPAQKAMEQEVKYTPKVVEDADTTVTIATTSKQISESGSKEPVGDLNTKEPEPDNVVEVEEKPFMIVEQKATFQGGDLSLFQKWVQEQIQYPEQALQMEAEGLVVLQFTVNSKGVVCDVNILKSSGFPFLDNEAKRAILSSPRWEPARQSGRDVGQLFNLPVQFKLAR